MRLAGKKIAVLMESDFYEREIFYYQHRFEEEGAELHFLTRLWGQPKLTFTGHEHKIPFDVYESFEGMDDETLRSFSAVIVPSAIVSDRLRYTEDINKLPPAVEFLRRAFAEPGIVKGIICHGMWLVAPVPELVRGRRVVVHNNLLGDAKNMGAVYVDQDLVVDGDLVTARTGGHCHLLARQIIDMLAGDVAARQTEATPPAFHHMGLSCVDPVATERFYTRYFGFHRARVVPLGEDKIVFLKNGDAYLELFQAKGGTRLAADGAGPETPGWRHIAFRVADVDAKLAEMGQEARVTLGPIGFDDFIPGWRTAWVADPDGNIVEISHGFVDQAQVPELELEPEWAAVPG